MKRRIVMALLVTTWSLTGAVGAFATGFSIYEAGTRATALGGAFTASADDGSALFYNPAGLSFQSGTSIDLNAMAIQPRFKFAEATSMSSGAPATGEGADNTFLVPGAYVTHNGGGKLSFGIGVYAPFGLGVEWNDPNAWIGRQASYDVSIETVYVTPAISYLFGETFAVSLGLDLAHQNLKLNRLSLDPTHGENAINQAIDGSSDLNVTPTLGLMFRPDEKLSVGLMYHHKKAMKYTDGSLELSNVAASGTAADNFATVLLANLNGGVPTDALKTTVESELNLPWILSLGLSYRFSEKFRAEANYVRFGWSEFKSLELKTPIGALNQTLDFDYEDSWQIRTGVEFSVNEKLDLMGGYVRDTTPQPIQSVSPILPDSDRNDYSLGLRYKLTNWDFNFAYMAVIGEDRTNIVDGRSAAGSATYPTGTYKSLANIFGVGASYHF